MQQSGGQQDSLAHAFGIGRYRGMPVGVQRKQAEQTVYAQGGGAAGKVSQKRDHAEEFEAGEMGIEMRLFGDVAHAAPVSEGVLLNRDGIEEDFAGGGFDESGDHFHGGGFAGAVRA